MALVDRVMEDAMARAKASAEDLGPDLEASFLEEVSRLRRHQAHYAEARELASAASELREEHWGEHHPLTGRAKKRLADVVLQAARLSQRRDDGRGRAGRPPSARGPASPRRGRRLTRFSATSLAKGKLRRSSDQHSRQSSASGRSSSVPRIPARCVPSRRSRR